MTWTCRYCSEAWLWLDGFRFGVDLELEVFLVELEWIEGGKESALSN